MANGAEPTAASTELEAGVEDSEKCEEVKLTNNEHPEDPQIKPTTNGLEVHWGFSLPDLYRIALKFYKGTWLTYICM